MVKDVSAFSLQPALFDISVPPGGTHQATISVVNDEKVERTYYTTIQKFFPKGESGQQEFLPLSDISGLPSWLFVTDPIFVLKPGESRSVSFMIRTPLDAQAGGHYAAVFFSTEPPIQRATGKILAGARTGVLIFLTIQGQLSARLEAKEFSANPTSIQHLPVLFRARVENTGNIHTIPRGEIIIKNYFGSEVTRLPLNPLESRILPNSARAFFVTWQKTAPRPGKGFWHEVGEEWRNFGLGRYRAQLELDGVATAPVVFTVFPWQFLLCAFVVLLLFIVLLKLYRRWILYRATAR
ncbi:hypothetical protein FJZ48_01360 [Candidatus Uhrbacteria bacterium]|nr:hypothetical protein [Candidatus Uhrbacteria bacterium]